MNKIKYANFSIRTKIKKHFKGEELVNFEKIIEGIAKKYKVEKAIIKDVDLDFDYLNIVLSNHDNKTYIIAFDYQPNNLVYVKKTGDKLYDILEIFDNEPFIIKSGYENLKEQIKIEKIYTKNEKESYVYSINGIPYTMYVYRYKNPYLETEISLSFSKNRYFQDYLFMKKLFLIKDIITIEELYKKIIEIINTSDVYIEITNKINKEFPEKIITKNGNLIAYKKNIKNGDEEKYLDYHDDVLYITKKVNPDTNDNINNFKKVLRRNK